MIRSIRSLFNSLAGKIIALAFVGVIALAFALGDVTGSGSFGGLGGGNIAKVGDRKITLGEFNQSLENALRGERQNNPTLDMGRFVASGGLDATLNQLINRYAIAVFGEKYGVAVSKRLVDFEIRKIPGSTGLDGKFSADAFRAVLGRIGVSEKMVRDDFTQNLFAQQILPTTISGPRAPDGLVVPYASLLFEKRSGQMAVIPSIAFLPKTMPSDAELSKYYRANTVQFTIPEKRAVSYALFTSDIVTAKAKPTEADIAAYYKENAKQYSATQTRDFSQVIAPTQAAAKALADKIAQGQSIAAVAGGAGLSVTNSSGITKEALESAASPAVANAAFAAPVASIVPPSKGALGWYVIRVNAVNQKAARPLAAVSGEIASALSVKKQDEAMADLTSEIEDEFAGGSTIADVAKTQGLKVETTPKLLANAVDTSNPNYKPIDEMKAILSAAFQMEQDGDAQLVEIIPGKKFAMVAVADVEEAAPPPIAQVRDVVVQQWALSEGSKKAKAAAEQVRSAVQGGKPLNEALAALGVKLPATQTVFGTRGDLNKDGKPLSPPLALLFSMKMGSAKTLQAPGNSGWFVVKVDQIIKGDARGQKDLLQRNKGELSAMLGQEYASQLIQSAIGDIGIKKNATAIGELRARLTKSDTGN